MESIPPQEWRPSGIDDLEPNAWRALRWPGSTCIVAGPGAGKTEFLAQRAVYLLQTGACRPPCRVLAISFKSDAAENLAARVRHRCPPELASRFVSLTFDAFTKGLVDRFLSAIPLNWRLTRPYDIALPTSRQIDEFLTLTRVSAHRDWQGAIAAVNGSAFEARDVGTYRLPVAGIEPKSGREYAIQRWWASQLQAKPHSSVTFVSLNRLAELLLRANIRILRALRATYPFVFVDEFQDTTYAQYDYLLSAFSGARISVTAVGDDKQRIMGWAGAREDAFERFKADFAAERIELQVNFRSSPDLVRIQYFVARALDARTIESIAKSPRKVDGDVAQIWVSTTRAAEANHLVRWLTSDMEKRNGTSRDYALLVRQKAEEYEAEFAGPLAAAGLGIRNESRRLGRTTLQDLLADELQGIVIALLRLGATRRAPEAWRIASAAVQVVRGADPADEVGCSKVERQLSAFLSELRAEMNATTPTEETVDALASRVFDFLELDAIARTFTRYNSGDHLAIMIEAFRLHLAACAATASDWTSCIDVFQGLSQIPLMTVHKSKGLEYDTVIFIGLDDHAWWSHVPNNPEGLATFFVALSRAKQRVIFAFCQNRGQRKRVADLYQLLTEAGVPEISI